MTRAPRIVHGDCLEIMKMLPENSVDSIVTDPPYELSNDGKSSANRVFAEMVLPKDSHLKALACGEDVLPFFVGEVSKLGSVRLVPSPAPAVPVGAVALDDQPAVRDDDVIDGVEGAIGIPGDATGVDGEPESPVHLGSFALKLADPSQLIEVVGKLGACFEAGRLGVGLGVSAAGFPAPQPGLSWHGVHGGVGFRDRALADLVGAFRGTGRGSVLSLDLGSGAVEQFTADGARVFAAILLSSGAELVRASAPARGLPAVLESRRISVVDDAANRAFTFDLILHSQSISSVGFMGKAWDGSKIAYDVALWREALRVLKPGGHLLAFGGTRTWHRLAVAVEDAGFEIRDSIAWMYGSGFPKSLDVSKAIDKQRHDGDDKIRVTSYFADVAERNGVTRRDIDAHMGTSDMGGWWLSRLKHRCAIPTPDQVPGLLEALRLDVGDVPADMRRLITELNGLKGQPGEAFTRREVIGHKKWTNSANHFVPGEDHTRRVSLDETAPATPDAQQWQGWGTALKPAFEPAVVARKPLAGTVAATVVEFGTGAINIDATRNGERWPANVILDESQADALAESKYFYTAKASKAERPVVDGVAHPTVKPLALMRWLVRLVTPEGGTVLEPFAGSGATVEACILEGFHCIAIEREAEYLPLIQARIDRQDAA